MIPLSVIRSIMEPKAIAHTASLIIGFEGDKLRIKMGKFTECN